MIKCHALLRQYSFRNGARRYRIKDNEMQRYEVIFGENKEFEELLISVFLWDKFYPSERKISFGTQQYNAFEDVRGDIEQLIAFLTNRKISIRFVPVQRNFSQQQRIFSGKLGRIGRGKPCLFSGGLDSTTGTLVLTKEGSSPTLSHTATGNIILGKARKLREHPTLRSLPMIVTDMRSDRAADAPVMTRGLLFLSNALILASSMGHDQIYFPENGPLMINPRVSFLSEPTKNAHPYLIRTLEKIYNHVTQSKVRINPIFKDETKAEVIAKILNDDIIDRTWSCFRVQGQSKMCGLCFACLVRRLSALAVGYQEPAKTYQHDLFLVEREELGYSMKFDLDILYDAFLYLQNLLRDDNLLEKDMFLVPEDFFVDALGMMRNFALDMFLGVHHYKKNSRAPRLGSLGNFVFKIIKDIPLSSLEEREDELESVEI